MTKSELWKGLTLRLLTAAVFGVIGYFALDRALAMVGIFGEGMGVDDRSRQIYADSHQIVHVFGAACSLALGVFILTGNKTLRWLAVVALLSAGGYGILNMIGFTSTNRVSVAAAKDADKSAAEREYIAAKKALEDTIGWAQATARQEDGRERRRLLSYVDDKRKELAALKAPRPDASKVLSDPQATTLAELTHSDARRWQLALPIPLAILLFFAEAFSFVVVGHMLAGIVGAIVAYRASEPAPLNQRTNSGSGGSSGSGGKRNVVHLPEPTKPAQPLRAEPSKQRSVFYVPSTGAPERLSAFDRAFEAYLANPHLSTRELAKRSGTSQSTAHRTKVKQLGKVHSTVRKYGNGRGYQTPAYN